MKTFLKLAMSVLGIFALAASVVAQAVPEVSLANLAEGEGLIGSNSNQFWGGYSELVLIPGAALMGASSATTVLTLGFTGGSTADVGNMVLYQTARGSDAVVKVSKVTLGGSQSPSINLTSPTTCPVQPVSPTNPCLVKLDAIKAALSPLSDYYFVIYFTLDTNNEKLQAAGQTAAQGALSGWFLYGDQTRIGVKGALPTNENLDQPPFFLMYVTNQ